MYLCRRIAVYTTIQIYNNTYIWNVNNEKYDQG